MIKVEWPFGHLSQSKASPEAIYIAETNMRSYAADAIVVRELKRYLLVRKVLNRCVTMQSKLVDDAWHRFIIDTRNYHAFCERIYGEYLHHESAHFALDESFPVVYQELFGEELPLIWLQPDRPETSLEEIDSYYNSGNCA